MRCTLAATIGPTLLLLVLWTPTVDANCESGAYLIHTVAEYAELDNARQWILRLETEDWVRGDALDPRDLLLVPTAAETTYIIHRLHNLLMSDEGSTFEMAVADGEPCRPDLSTARIVDPAGLMIDAGLAIRPCAASDHGGVPADQRYAIYDRDSRLLWFPPKLSITDETPDPPPATVEPKIRQQMIGLGTGGDSIRAEDLDSLRTRHLRIGDPENGLGVVVAVARLRNLGRLLGGEDKSLYVGGGYWHRDEVAGKLADFPVIFFRRGDGAPHYVADGSWCGGYRLGMEEYRSEDENVLGVFERFVFDAAWDTDDDGFPNLLLVNETILYQIGDRPDDLWVVDYQMGC